MTAQIPLPGRLLTLDEWEALPESEGKMELVEGVVVMVPPANTGHHYGADSLCMVLRSALPREQWVAIREIGVYLSTGPEPTARQPDLTVIRRSAYAADRHSYLPVEVLLVVEFISPGTRGTDRVMKRHEYAKAGIPNYWIADLRAADPGSRFSALRLTQQGEYQELSGAFVDGRVDVPDLGGITVRFNLSDLEG